MSLDDREIRKSIAIFSNREERDYGDDKFNVFLKQSEEKEYDDNPLARSKNDEYYIRQNVAIERIKRTQQGIQARDKKINSLLFETSESFRP